MHRHLDKLEVELDWVHLGGYNYTCSWNEGVPMGKGCRGRIAMLDENSQRIFGPPTFLIEAQTPLLSHLMPIALVTTLFTKGVRNPPSNWKWKALVLC